MNFTSAQKCLQTIQAGDDVEYIRSENRRKVNDLLNCVPPCSEDVAEKMNLKVNVNWGEAAVLAWHARRQYNNAFLKPARFFKIGLPDAPPEKKGDWERTMTKKANRPLKRSKTYIGLTQAKHAGVVAHGIGAQLWEKQDGWLPKFVAVENLRVPTDTKTDLSNLSWFAVRTPYTPGELSAKVFGEHKRKGWNKKAIQEILSESADRNYEDPEYNWSDQPEKMAELYKQNGHFYSGDAVPAINLWHLYFEDQTDGESKGWRLRVLPDQEVKGLSDKSVFLFNDGDTSVGEDLSEILHIQFGDLSAKPPFLYHSVRSLGFLLMEPCFFTNLMRCRLVQHVFENFNILFRTSDPAGRARAQKVELFDRAFIPDGVGIVPQSERHQIDPNLLNSAMAQLRQLMQEASSSYTQEIDSGQRKEQTAYETAVKMNMVNAMLSGLLFHAFVQETFAYREIGRRLCLTDTKDKDAIRFQEECLEYGIPPELLNVDEWDIEPEIPIGAGNPVVEQAQIKELMQARPLYNPVAQQEILHNFTSIITDDPKTAERLVPLDTGREISDAFTYAQLSFPVLMMGQPVSPRPELNVTEQIEVYIGMAAGVITRILKNGGNAVEHEIVGLRMVEAQIKQLLGQLAQDPSARQKVKQYQDQIMKLFNEVKGFEQRLQAKNKAEGSPMMDPKVQAKIAEMMAVAETKNKIDVMEAGRQQERDDLEFSLEQGRRDAEVAAEIERENLKAQNAPPPKTPSPAKKK